MASPDSIPAAPAAFVAENSTFREAGGISAFRRVPWRVSDLVIGLAVLLPWRLAASLDRSWLLALPVWAYWALYLFPPVTWMVLFPVWTARRRSPALSFTVPGAVKLLHEAGIAIVSWFAIFVCVVVGIVVARLVSGSSVTLESPLEGIGSSGQVASSVLYLLVVASIGPLSEELFFRGFLYNSLRLHCPVVLALFLQALVFGAMHSFNLTHSVFAFFLGLALAVVYDWRKTLITPIFVHCIQDAIAASRAAVVLIAAMNAPHLGINGTSVEQGCFVAVVQPGTTAEEIGLRKGDIIAKFDGKSVHNFGELSKLVRQRHLGDWVEIEVFRDGQSIVLQASLTHTLRQ